MVGLVLESNSYPNIFRHISNYVILKNTAIYNLTPNHMSKKRFLVSSLIFGAIGTAFGLLFAPRKGVELRKKILQAKKQGKEPTEIIKQELGIIGKDITETAKTLFKSKEVKKLIKQGKIKAVELKDMTKDKLNEILDKIEQECEYEDSQDKFDEEMQKKPKKRGKSREK